MCRGEGNGEGVDATLLSHTVRYINLAEGRHRPGWVAWTDAGGGHGAQVETAASSSDVSQELRY